MKPIRITKKQIELAQQARESALQKDPLFREFEQEREIFRKEAEKQKPQENDAALPGQPTFALTPRASNISVNSPINFHASLQINGGTIDPNFFPSYPHNYDQQYTQDQVYFWRMSAGNPLLDYRDFENRRKAPHVALSHYLGWFGEQKRLTLAFEYQVESKGRVQIYSYQDMWDDVPLIPGNNLFLIEFESLVYTTIYFIHVQNDGIYYGGNWFFRGIKGFVE